MSDTPTAALVDEAERKIGSWFRCNPEQRTMGLPGLLIELVAALRRAEAELDAATTQLAKKFKQLEELERRCTHAGSERDELRATVTRLNRRAQTAEAGVRDNVEACKAAGVSMGRTLANAAADMYLRRAEKAEAERDAQHAEVRLAGAVAVVKMRGRQIAELTATRDLLLTENAQLQQMLSRPDPVVHETPVDGVVPCCGQKLHDLKDGSRVNEGPLVNCDRMRLLTRVSELSSANLVLTAENARLQKEVATLELLIRGGK